MNDIKFMPLGGGQEIGASCYYLNLGGVQLLLDCGRGISQYGQYGPDFSLLTKHGELLSPHRLEGIIISHAHFDHIGSLLDFNARYSAIPIYATNTTKQLGRYMMDVGEKRFQGWEKANLFFRMREIALNTKKSIAGGRVDITLYRAGHIPGACMIYLQNECGSVLYTGDFSPHRMALAGKYALPDNINPNVVIICGVHAKHPSYKLKRDMDSFLRKLSDILKSGKSVFLKTKQLTKGIELIHQIDDAMERGMMPDLDIFYDENISKLAYEFNKIRIRSLTRRCHAYDNSNGRQGVFIGKDIPGNECVEFLTDFSLHADYDEIKELLCRLNSKKIIVVHTGDTMGQKNEHALERDFWDSTVYYPKNGELIIL